MTCTGLAARWCDIHGACTCPVAGDTDDDGWSDGRLGAGESDMDGCRPGNTCPLHSLDSDHAEPA